MTTVSLFLLFLFFASSHSNEGSGRLNVEVEWIIQTRVFTFSGFFVEFLGFMDGFINQLPQIRLLSSYFNDFNDSPYDEQLLYEMFPKESTNFKQLRSILQPIGLPYNAHPSSKIFFTKKLIDSDGKVCGVVAEEPGGVGMRTGVSIAGGDMNRFLFAAAHTAADCCQACLEQPLCIGWSFHNTCSFKSRVDGPGVSELEAHRAFSGSFKRRKALTDGRLPIPRVRIFHGTNCIYQNETIRFDPDVILIGRYMTERGDFSQGTSIHEHTVILIMAIYDPFYPLN